MASDPTSLHDQNKSVAIDVLKTVWHEFYAWEQEECRHLLGALATTAPKIPRDSEDFFQAAFPPQSADPERAESSMLSITTYGPPDLESGIGRIHEDKVSCVTITPQNFARSPGYEACTPISRSVPRAPDHNHTLAFIPYADDREFNIDELLGSYLEGTDQWSWQDDFKDPDVEVMVAEAVRRLISVHEFTVADIDELGVFRRCRIDARSGLFWDISQRDMLHWPGSFSDLPELPCKAYVNLSRNIFELVNDGIQLFCPNLNCATTHCTIHTKKYLPLMPQKAMKTSDSLKRKRGESCGDDCFRLMDEQDNLHMEEVQWEDPADIGILEGVLKLCPDTMPCDLAVICRKRCREIFAFRCRYLSDEDIMDSQASEPQQSHLTYIQPNFIDSVETSGTPEFIPLHPCHHKGPCDINSNCPCYLNDLHCERDCRCDRKCRIRWKGCRCKPSSGSKPSACQANGRYCPCRIADRECDPDVCGKCDARWVNCSLKGPNWEANLSKYRLATGVVSGAFAAKALRKGAYIGEYVGHIVLEAAPDDEQLHHFTDLNYCFKLNPKMILDAAKAGNETRYLNHRDDPNCEAVVIYVNGEHRIVLQTTKAVRRDEELFLDYGPDYWKDHQGKQPLADH